jgi:hypothetical protein
MSDNQKDENQPIEETLEPLQLKTDSSRDTALQMEEVLISVAESSRKISLKIDEACLPIIESSRKISLKINEACLPIIEASRKIGLQLADSLSVFQMNLETMRPQFEKLNEFGQKMKEFLIPYHLAKKLADSQIIITKGLSIEDFNELLDSEEVDQTYLDILERDKFKETKEVIAEIEDYFKDSEFEVLIRQSFEAYSLGLYNVAIIGLLVVLDGALTKLSNNTSTNLSKKIDSIIYNSSSEDNLPNMFFIITFDATVETVSAFISFEGEEPSTLNRHWILHGRSKREYSQLDSIKIINLLYSIIILGSGKN